MTTNVRVDLYKDEVGGLYMHREGDAYIFPIAMTVVAQLADTLAGVP